MIRVLHCVDRMNRGGIESLLMNIYRNIDRSKVQFDFLVHTKEEGEYDQEIRNLGGRIYSVFPRSKGIQKNRKSLDEFFKTHAEYKVVHQHLSSLSYVTPLKIARKNKVPVRIVHGHNTKQGGRTLHKFIHKYNQLFINKFATHYFACSKLAAKWLYSKEQYESNNYELINNAIETENFLYNMEVRNNIRNELNLNGKFVLGHIGRFSHQKNHEFLIDIFNTIYDMDKNTVLLLVGDGSLYSDIKSKVEELNLEQQVIFLGIRRDIPHLLQAMDVFVMPSHHEGLPVTVVEAQASGLPCVLSKNITDEVEITPNVSWCQLEDDTSIWAKSILQFKNNYHREDTKERIVASGYDIAHVAENLLKKYVSSVNDFFSNVPNT